MSLALSDLELLLDVAERGSFSQAAALRGWSQPQVSNRVALMETELGVVLFKRHRRGASPTSACEDYLVSVRQALSALRDGQRRLQGAPALPLVRLGCMPSLASTIFGPLIAALADAVLEIRCDTDHSPALMESLLTARLQLGFVLKCPPMAGIQMEQLGRSPIIAVVAAEHELAQAGRLTLANVADYRLAPQGWGDDCDELIRMIHSRRTVAQPLHAIQPAAAARELALAYGFLTFMPAVAVMRELQAGRLKRLDIVDLPPSHWEVMMAYRPGKRPDVAREQVLAAARAIGAAWREAGVA